MHKIAKCDRDPTGLALQQTQAIGHDKQPIDNQVNILADRKASGPANQGMTC